MSIEFNSFKESPLKAFTESPLHARGGDANPSVTAVQSVVAFFDYFGYLAFVQPADEVYRIFKTTTNRYQGNTGHWYEETLKFDEKFADLGYLGVGQPYYIIQSCSKEGLLYQRESFVDGTTTEYISPFLNGVPLTPADQKFFLAEIFDPTLFSENLTADVKTQIFSDGTVVETLTDEQTIDAAITKALELLDTVSLNSPDATYQWWDIRVDPGTGVFATVPGTFGYKYKRDEHPPWITQRAFLIYEPGFVNPNTGQAGRWPNDIRMSVDTSDAITNRPWGLPLLMFATGSPTTPGEGSVVYQDIDDRTVSFTAFLDFRIISSSIAVSTIRVKKSAVLLERLGCVVTQEFDYTDAGGWAYGEKGCLGKRPLKRVFEPTSEFGRVFLQSSLGSENTDPPIVYYTTPDALPPCCTS